MARVTSGEVETLLQNDFESGDVLTPYITTANRITSKVSAADTGSLLDSDDLKDIELYLAAHYYTFQNHQLKSEKTGDASGEYAGEYGLGLDGSKYGQAAKSFDLTGYLNRMSNGVVRASATWLGKPPSDQIAYEDRD